ncbi:aspartyl-tRNA(Asn)/glutamyl-tRNA(Gln) amidotransferase subunit A [Roseinatronobacter thiooxidans]|uniref:Aspartyl-tRNA(Asn)/glutamyl-tRNA(Gln) amidotransferase subunit A n=1 Tax=Roseinatronobacter thiooxidans TaxID=121821 RepID=A0A2W7PKF4_9RHOB|nr:amidase [Roseinatronobacter thiooxidans]PZX36754.1 aspartyl-tRNA(Asn)/glutamyl-tRNA(Gln) amidotransferase subunit A [Roseinatronobacter thiooxidans]
MQTLAQTARAIRDGEITAEAATEAALHALEDHVRPLNGIARLTPDAALESARSVDLSRAKGASLPPLAGVPMAHKDLFYRAGRPSHCGTKIRDNFVPDVTATVLSRLDGAGAIDLGTLHMAEIAMSPTGFNEHHGHGLNPWNPAHICGGSSSGSGIAVSAGAVTASLGTDTGGSVRHPAAACGLTGLKPTHGAVSLAGVMPLSGSLDCVGPLCHTALDVALIMDVIGGEDRADPTTAWAPFPEYTQTLADGAHGLKIARPRGYYDCELDPEVENTLAEALATFVSIKVTLSETRLEQMDLINAFAHLVLSSEASSLHRRLLADRPDDYAAQVRARIEPGLAYPATHYIEALTRRGALAKDWIMRALQDADAALLPVFPTPVPTIMETTEGGDAAVSAVIGRLTRNTRGINYLGLPAVVVPCGISASGLPIAFQLVGRPWSEPILLRLADAYQRVTHWHDLRPERPTP